MVKYINVRGLLMKLNKAINYIPKAGKPGPVKYLTICAHQDDNEIMAIDGIMRGYRSRKYSFACVVTADGGGSARTGKFADYTDEMMKEVRIEEQKKAAEIGRYHALHLLNYSSKEIKDPENEEIINDYVEILREYKPKVLYTHSILDKHPTHLGVVTKVIRALRLLKPEEQPKVVYGCEVWRDLDWVADKKKVCFDVSHNIRLQKSLLNVFESQIAGGKAYTNATIGRRYNNATYAQSHSVDNAKLVTYAINMTKLIRDPELPMKKFALSFVDDLYTEINDAMDRIL